MYVYSLKVNKAPLSTCYSIGGGRDLHGLFKNFGEFYQKTNKTKDINKFSLLLFKIVAIRYNTGLTMFVQLLETISKDLLWNQSQNGCHMIFDGIHVLKTCTPDGCLQAGKQEEVHRSLCDTNREQIFRLPKSSCTIMCSMSLLINPCNQS